MFPQLSINLKFILMVLVMGIIFTVTFAVLNRVTHQTQRNWVDYRDQVAQRQKQLMEIKSQFGYGGGIHTFKNYVLRKDPMYFKRSEEHFTHAARTVYIYGSIQGLTQKEHEALRAIEKVLNKYRLALLKAQEMFQEGKLSNEVDKVVRVDDRPAFYAFTVLETKYDEMTQRTTSKIGLSIVTNLNMLVVSLFVSFIVIVGFSIIIARSMTKPLEEALDAAKKSQGELEESELRIRMVMDSTVDGIIVIDEGGIVESFNPGAERLFGYQASEVIGKLVNMLLPESESSQHDEYIQKYLRTGQAKIIGFGREVKGLRKDGSEFPMELGVNELQLEVGRRFVGSLHDLTERKKAEEAAAAERLKFYEMLNHLPVLIHLKTPDYSIPFANKMLRERFGDPEDKMCYELLHDRPIPCEDCKSFAVLQTGETRESLWKARDGRTYLTVETPFQDVDGTPLVMEMGIDITERKRAEEAVIEARATLERRVVERTAELAAANKDMEDFTHVASHDLKEPLRKIVAFGDRLRSKSSELSPQSSDYLDRMQNAAYRMQTLIDDLLKLSRLATQKDSFRRVNFKTLVDEVLIDLETRVAQTGGTVHLDDFPTLEADPVQMRQLFQNLISNALKYHREGVPPVVQVSCSRNGQGSWEFKVKDNGIGFDEKYIDRIFKPFERLHGRSSYDGTGIGLAICQKIVARHNGSIAVSSQPGEGSCFTVSLPEKHS